MELQRFRTGVSRMTQPELEYVKKAWEKALLFRGLLTLGAIAYVATEALSGELKFSQMSDALVTVSGAWSAYKFDRASSMLSSVKKYIVPPISTR